MNPRMMCIINDSQSKDHCNNETVVNLHEIIA